MAVDSPALGKNIEKEQNYNGMKEFPFKPCGRKLNKIIPETEKSDFGDYNIELLCAYAACKLAAADLPRSVTISKVTF